MDYYFVSPPVCPVVITDSYLLDEDDLVLADLKVQRKKLNVKKHKVLSEIQNELLVLLQPAESELE